MKSLKYAAIMVLLVGAPVLADSMVAYSIDVGGDNNSATYEAGGLYPPFTTSSQYTYNVGDVVTWDVSVAVSGTHNNSGGAGHDLAPLGAANLVANLTLYLDANENGVAEAGEEVLVGAAPISCATGVPADGSATACEPTAAGFFSSINDGDADGSSIDGLAVAAYAAGFDADDNGSKHGTIVSAVADDGPNFDFAFLPSANGLAGKRADQIGTTPVYAANVDLSEMVGIGAGIKEFDFAPIGHLPGVGMTGTLGIYDNDCDTSFARGGLGTGPVFEGQIATDDLDPGSYILVVEPGQGNNIIHGDIYCADEGGDPYYGNYSDTFGTFAAEANDTDGGEITFVLEPPPADAVVVDRHIFYNQSFFDGNNAAANVSDDSAIATDKVAYLAGSGAATFVNYISYNKGVNGIMVDIQGLAGVPTAADFDFHYGNTNTPAAWTAGPTITDADVYVRAGEGTAGSDRVTVIFANNSMPPQSTVVNNIPNKNWLEVVVKATANTGLPDPDVHYWGLAVAEVGNDFTTNVNATDEIQARLNPRNFFVGWAVVTDPWDYNRDRSVNATDEIIARLNPASFFTGTLLLINLP